MKHSWMFIASALMFAAAACQLPGATPETELFPTPDLTMTAIYAVLFETQETPTWTPVAVTETLLPTLTSYPTGTFTPLPPTPTSTLAPTQTSVLPTASPTRVPLTNTPRPLIRSGASITATYLGVRPDINGSLGEWNLTKYTVTSVVFGSNLWDNADDLSARVMVGWDTANLYLAVEVFDEDYEQNTGGENMFRGDSLEILLDTNIAADFYVDYLTPDDFQLGISPGSPIPDEDPEAYLWFPTSIDGGRSQIEIAAVRTDDGYNVEVAIPWSIFEMAPQSGQHYGFAISVSDNDIDGGIAQQSMISNVASRILADPTTWGGLLLYRP
jgi:hypothetical protein